MNITAFNLAIAFGLLSCLAWPAMIVALGFLAYDLYNADLASRQVKTSDEGMSRIKHIEGILLENEKLMNALRMAQSMKR